MATRPNAWQVLPFEEGAPAALLARGRALLDDLEREPVPTLRWYVADRTAIVLGRGQAAELAASSTSEVEVLTRFSGGGAVLMDPDLLSLDVLVPAGHPYLGGDDLGMVFRRVGAAWAAALSEIGVPHIAVYDGPAQARRRGSAREQLLAAVCYATLGRGEVTTAGRKLVGLAQRRRRAGALVQCGLLRRWEPRPLLVALGGDPDDVEIHSAAIGIDSLGKGKVAVQEITAAVERRLTLQMEEYGPWRSS